MKSFQEMSQDEIKKMSDEEFLAISPFDKKSCYDCCFLYSALSWWCGNNEASSYRGTRIPGIIKCKFWKPNWKRIDKKYKTEENGYIPPKIKTINKVIIYIVSLSIGIYTGYLLQLALEYILKFYGLI